VKQKIVERRVGNATADVSKYITVRTASGRASLDCGDRTARELRGKTLDEVYKVAAKVTGQSERTLRRRYRTINAGLQRMAIGNLIRGAAR
jgi:hypothetical protein